jgi:hypothetical protein
MEYARYLEIFANNKDLKDKIIPSTPMKSFFDLQLFKNVAPFEFDNGELVSNDNGGLVSGLKGTCFNSPGDMFMVLGGLFKVLGGLVSNPRKNIFKSLGSFLKDQEELFSNPSGTCYNSLGTLFQVLEGLI